MGRERGNGQILAETTARWHGWLSGAAIGMPNRHPQCVASLNRPRRGWPLDLCKQAAAASAVLLEQAQTLRRSPGQGLTDRPLPLLQAQVTQDLLDDLGVLDGRDDQHPTAALAALLNV